MAVTRMDLRMETNMRDAVEKASISNRRSMNSQILVILEEWLTEHGYEPWPKKKRAAK